MRQDPVFDAGAVQIPEHVTGAVREMFRLIALELNRRNDRTGEADPLLIEKLAAQLTRIREVDSLVLFGYAIASAAEAIKTKCWISACEFAADLQLPLADLERLVWGHSPVRG